MTWTHLGSEVGRSAPPSRWHGVHTDRCLDRRANYSIVGDSNYAARRHAHSIESLFWSVQRKRVVIRDESRVGKKPTTVLGLPEMSRSIPRAKKKIHWRRGRTSGRGQRAYILGQRTQITDGPHVLPPTLCTRAQVPQIRRMTMSCRHTPRSPIVAYSIHQVACTGCQGSCMILWSAFISGVSRERGDRPESTGSPELESPLGVGPLRSSRYPEDQHPQSIFILRSAQR